MFEVLKIGFQSIYWLFKRRSSRLTARSTLAIDPQKEHYRSADADSSRIFNEKEDLCFIGVRVPSASKRIFSIMMPAAFSSFEKDFFSQQPWARYFEDDREGSENKGKRGYYLPWNDTTNGVENLFAVVWLYVLKLPVSLFELHHDGKHLRAIFRTDRREAAKLDLLAIKSALTTIAISVNAIDGRDLARAKNQVPWFLVN